MWIVSPTCGLLSIVLADGQSTVPTERDLLMLRARSREHLALLKRQHPVLAEIDILQSAAGRDYGWRMLVERATLARVLGEMASTLTWRNVKAEAHRNERAVGPQYVRAMHRIHAEFVDAGEATTAEGDSTTPSEA